MQLEEFMHIKEKRKANNSVKEDFKKEFLSFLTDNGINEKSAEYAVVCMSLGSPEVVNQWCNDAEPEDIRFRIKKLFETEAFLNSKNRYNACAFAIRMIGLNSGVNHNQIIVEESIKVVPAFAHSSDGKLQKSFTKIVKNYLMGSLAIHINFISLDKLDIDNTIISSFSKLINRAVMEIIANDINANDKRKADLILEWVASHCVELAGTKNLESIDEDSIKEGKSKEQVQEDLTEENKTESKAYSKLVCSIFEIANNVQNLENHITQFNKQKALMTATIKEREKKIDGLEQGLANAMAEIDKLNMEKTELMNEIQNKEQSINSLDEDVQKRDQMIEFQQKEKVASESEKLNRIASELKLFYDEYNEAKSMQLSADIAAVLIDDLDSVFRVLKKNGIEIK